MDDGELIEQVVRFPVLYNKSDPRFKSKIDKEAAWIAIGGILNENADVCEQRWCTLRGKYTKIKRCLRTTPPDSEPCLVEWPYFDCMRFLDPFLTTRRSLKEITLQASASKALKGWTTGTPKGETSDLETSEVELETSELEGSPPPTPSSSEVRVSKGNRIPRPSMPEKLNAQEAMHKNISSRLQTFSQKMGKPEEDFDLHFAKSLAKDMSILTAEEKIVFKKRIYDVFSDIIEKRH